MRLTPEVRQALESATVDGCQLTLNGQLDRQMYLQVNKVLECLGGKWNGKAKAHVFEYDAEDVVADAVATGCVVDAKKEFGFFETPVDVAQTLVKMADIATQPDGALILEPSAGSGRILGVIEAAGCEAAYCELDPGRAGILQERYAGQHFLTNDFLKLNEQHQEYPHNAKVGGGFDCIIANPPFSRGQDVAHVTHMMDLLAPGGVVVSIMSPSWRFRTGAKFEAFRSRVKALHGEWTDLPKGTFKASGTDVNTGILRVRR